MKRIYLLAALLALFTAVATARAEDKVTLNMGDPAPKLTVRKWFNGEPVESFEKGKVYVVECWATWCGPCKQSIPHLSEMNTKLKDKGVTFIGVDVLEEDDAGVEPFIKQMGEKMNYRVALDSPAGENGAVVTNWLKAAGQNGIPSAFVVDKEGKIAWIGHPMDGLEATLEKIVAGTYDMKAAVEQKKKMSDLQEKLGAAQEKGDFDAMLKIADEVAAATPAMAPQAGMMKFQITLKAKKDGAGAAKIATGLFAKEFKDDAQALNAMAWDLMDAAGIENRDFDLSMKMALRADELTNHKEGAILDTLARAYFEKKDIAKAIETQKAAIAIAPAEQKEELGASLKKYEDAAKK